jgi:hypothetical protein
MTSPRVTETPLRIEPVEPDPFIDALPRSTAVRPRLTEPEERERRVELVRRPMRIQAGDGPARNGWAPRRTQRA